MAWDTRRIVVPSERGRGRARALCEALPLYAGASSALLGVVGAALRRLPVVGAAVCAVARLALQSVADPRWPGQSRRGSPHARGGG
jgi:hypothetical protein